MKLKDLVEQIPNFDFSTLVLRNAEGERKLRYAFEGNEWHDPYTLNVYPDTQVLEAQVLDIRARGYCNLEVMITM